MYRFLESICFDGSGYPLLDYHQDRVDRVFADLYHSSDKLKLAEILPPRISATGIHKIRVQYDDTGYQVEVVPYIRKPVSQLQVVVADAIEYDHKYTDRTEINNLFALRNEADDILIVKNGLLTDTSYANVALLKNNIWYTPEKPLLPGVRRAQLIATGEVKTTNIRPEDLGQYEQLTLFNAMIDLGEVIVPIGNISQ